MKVIKLIFAISVSLLLSHSPATAAAAQLISPDATLFTTYDTFETATSQSLSYTVCGKTDATSGCYGFGALGAHERVCAVLESIPKTSGNVTTRQIYVLDGKKTTGKAMTLSTFTKVDTLTSTDLVSKVTPGKVVTLPVKGGPKVSCLISANPAFLFIGAANGTTGVKVRKSTLAVATLPNFSPVSRLTMITANEAGFVSVVYEGGHYIFDPKGNVTQSGGTTGFVTGTK